MEKTAVQKLAGVLRVLVTLAFVCNLLALPLVPGLVGIGRAGFQELLELTPYEGAWETPLQAVIVFFLACWQYLFRVWREPDHAVLAGFLLFCGANTAVILWQARRVLGTIIATAPFQRANARSMDRAAVSFALIALAALCRTAWGFFYYRSLSPLFTYNALFVPVFAMGALLCMVMSALFRQAAELKEDSDLTI